MKTLSSHPNAGALDGAPIYSSDEIRSLETRAEAGLEGAGLMERAGLAAAELALELVGDTRRPVLVLAGPGNNGGDGFVLARHLKQRWHPVRVVYRGDRSKLPADAAAALTAWEAAGGECLTTLPSEPLTAFGLIVDALFGIGLKRELSEPYADWVERANASGVPILALDIPSGLDADSGRVLGRAIRARHTITFIALKPGLLTLDGPDHCGALHVNDLQLAVEQLQPARGHVVRAAVLREALPRRALNSHKGTFGNVGIVGGASGMTGAALLAGRAALQLGAGRIYVGFLGTDSPRLDIAQPELMLRSASEVLAMDGLSCLVLGPGLSQSISASDAVKYGLELRVPLVLDADALNLLGSHEELGDACRARTHPTILTPHPAEAGRLLQKKTSEVQYDRVAATRALVERYRSTVVLKGAGSVIGFPDGSYRINTSGNPGLSSAGMGDVLCGVLAALLAQDVEAELAATAGVYLHGAAADHLLASHGGPIGMTATEVTQAARLVLNRAVYGVDR